MLKSFPFSLNIPVKICDVKLNFHISETMRVSGLLCASSPHNHGDFELRYITSGKTNHIIQGKEVNLHSGDVILLHPGETHYQTEDSITPNLVQYSLRISIKNKSCPSSIALEELLGKITTLRDDKYLLAPLFNRLWKEIIDRKDGFFNYLQSLCQSIMIETIRLSDLDSSEIFTVNSSVYNSYWIDRLDRFLHDHYMEDIKLENLAQDINLSPRHASRMVMKEYGISFISKLTEIRLGNAKYQLKHTNKDLTSIATSCGFSSYSYFTSCFKKKIGITPGEYRTKSKSK